MASGGGGARAERAAARTAARAIEDAPSAEAPPSTVCYVCRDRGKAPLLRNCACRGTDAGFAHMECLVQCAVAAAAQGNANVWWVCGLCKQVHYGAVGLGLARVRWERARGRAEDDEERLIATHSLVIALDNSGEHAAALPLAEESLRMRRAKYGDEQRRTLHALDLLATLHMELKSYDVALPLARQALEVRRRLLGDEDEDTLVSINLLAVILRDMGNLAEALPLLEEDLRARRTLGNEHAETLISIHALGKALCKMFDFRTGLPLLREALDKMRKVLGEGHPHTQTSMETLAKFERVKAAAQAQLEEEEEKGGGGKGKRRCKQ